MKKYWFAFKDNELLIEKHPDGTFSIPLSEKPPTAPVTADAVHNITPIGNIEVKTYYIHDDDTFDTERYALCGLRASYYKLPAEMYLKAGKCSEILYWDASNAYCGRCGGKMRTATDISKRCTVCGKEIWPQLSTAVIVLVHKGKDEILLVHANNFRGNFYGLVAGFVETGETLEQAVEREVREETGLSIKNIRYYASQPWPYPCGLMVGFYAEYAGGTIRLQRSELASGGWYRRDSLPTLPEKLSIARRLIDHFLNDGDGNMPERQPE